MARNDDGRAHRKVNSKGDQPEKPVAPADGALLRNSRGGLWAAAFAVVSGVATWNGVTRNYRACDAGMFVWVGKRMLAGETLYRDLWDNKLPPVYWMNELAAASGYPQVTTWVLNVIGMVAAAWMIYRLASLWFDDFPAGLAGITYVTLYSTRYLLGAGNLTEHFAAPLAVLGVYAMVQYARGAGPKLLWPLLSGFGISAAAMFRLPAILVAGVLVALLPAVHRAGRLKLAPVLVWLGGLALAPAIVLLWAGATGVFQPMLDYCVFGGMEYASGSGGPGWATWEHVGREFRNLMNQLWIWHLPAVVGLVLLLLGLGVREDRPALQRQQALSWLALLWLVAAVLSTLPSLRFYGHYYVLVAAPLALISAWAWQGLWTKASVNGLTQAIGIGILVAGGLLVLHQYGRDRSMITKTRLQAQHVPEAVDYLASNGSDGDTLFVFAWGAETEIQAQLGWPSTTRHPMVLFYPHMPEGMEMVREWRSEMIDNPPDWLVAHGGFDPIQGTVTPRFSWDRADASTMVQQIARAYHGCYRPVKVIYYRNEKGDVALHPQTGRPVPIMVIYRRERQAGTPTTGASR